MNIIHSAVVHRTLLGFSEFHRFDLGSILSSLTLISTFVWVTLTCYKVACNCCEDSLIIFSRRKIADGVRVNTYALLQRSSHPFEFANSERSPSLSFPFCISLKVRRCVCLEKLFREKFKLNHSYIIARLIILLSCRAYLSLDFLRLPTHYS